MNFLRNLLAAIIGCLVAFGIIFIMIFVFASLVDNAQVRAKVKKNSVLEMQLQKPIKEYVGQNVADPFASFLDHSQGLDEILTAIKVAKNDQYIKGISINNNLLTAGLAQTQAIRKALEDFKQSRKFIYSYGDFYKQKEYYLASVADSVFLNPVGSIDFKGLASEVLFFKDFQEKTGVKMEVIRHGKYKSAVEPFLSNEMSDANRTQIQELMSSLWSSMINDIAVERNITPQNLNSIADTLGGRSPKYAKASKLVDDIIFRDQYDDKLRHALGLAQDDDINTVQLEEYTSRSNKKAKKRSANKIAVIFAQGEIMYGEGGPNIIGQGIINKAIIKAKEDKNVKAIVLRIDSPGGSALASDIIWREVKLAKAVKPVVVSMGNVAASGGYYIAVAADKIFAEPTTITGSIGVFGILPNINELATDIGINAEQVGTNKNANDYSFFEPITNNFKNTMQESIHDIYKVFLQRVSQGRGISIAKADSMAQGRIWSGVDAQKIGLVDELGNLDDAIAEAAKMADLKNYGIKKYPKYKSVFEQFAEDLSGVSIKSKERFIEQEIGYEAYGIFKQVKSAMRQKGVQVRMPFVLNIK